MLSRDRGNLITRLTVKSSDWYRKSLRTVRLRDQFGLGPNGPAEPRQFQRDASNEMHLMKGRRSMRRSNRGPI